MATYQDLGFFGNIQAATSNFTKYIGTTFFALFAKIQLLFPNVDRDTVYFSLFTIVLLTSVFLVYYYFGRDTADTTLIKQSVDFTGIYDSRLAQVKPTSDYYKQKTIQAMNKKNFVLLNTSLLTVKNAGFFGPEINGSFNVQAIRKALDIGARCFIFSVDYYTGNQKTGFAKPEEPCLLYRDNTGVIRSQNSGNIKEMMTVLADEAFTSRQFGSDPLLVIVDVKNVPSAVEEKQKHLSFLQNLANQISVLDKNGNVLKKINETVFTNQANPATLFVQNLDTLKKKILIFTNVDTSVYSQPDVVKLNLPRNSNLKMLTHAQIYSSSGNLLINDSVTKKPPVGTPASIAKETAAYWLQTPPESIPDAQKRTNPTYSIISDSDFSNLPIAEMDSLFNKFGVQIIPFQMFTSQKDSEDFFNWWGPFSIKIRPTPVQYIVQEEVQPAKISSKLNANGGNPTPPKLNL